MKPPFVRPATCLITKGDADTANYPHSKEEIVRQIKAAVEAGVSIIQIREKRLNARLIFEIALEAVATASQSDTLILVNERFDIALAAGADGVHLPSDSISASLLRRFTPRGFVIGVSAHTLDEVLGARDAGADFAVFGPVFPTPGKPRAVGLGELKRTVEAAAPFPVFALGGIDASNAEASIGAGAAGVAAIRFMNSPAGFDLALRIKNERE